MTLPPAPVRAPSQVVVLLGAGFNYDAASESGVRDHPYPMLGDLLRTCFGRADLPAGVSIEDLFADAIQRRDRTPVARLCELLQAADHYVGEALRVEREAIDGRHAADSHVERHANLYVRFLQQCMPSAILTFNYDSLVELLLFSMGRWRPDDGYGVPVHAELETGLVYPPRLPEQSSSVVLHLHGSLCLYSEEFEIRHDARLKMGMIEPRQQPEFIFDPDANTLSFFPFARAYPRPSYEYVDGRIIAPVPRKAEARQQVFVQLMTRRAVQEIDKAHTVLTIGYRFSEVDVESYHPLLMAARGKRIVLVLPEANALRSRLAQEYPDVAWVPQPFSFSEWGKRGFPMA